MRGGCGSRRRGSPVCPTNRKSRVAWLSRWGFAAAITEARASVMVTARLPLIPYKHLAKVEVRRDRSPFRQRLVEIGNRHPRRRRRRHIGPRCLGFLEAAEYGQSECCRRGSFLSLVHGVAQSACRPRLVVP